MHAAKTTRRSQLLHRAHQNGVVLVIALVLMIVIGISSALAMRTALFGDLVSHNMRSHNLAFQAAELALRFCEFQVINDPFNPAFRIIDLGNPSPAVNNEWQLAASWSAATINTAPAGWLGNTVNYQTPPICIVRRMTYDEVAGTTVLPPDAPRPEDRGVSPDFLYFFRITARGYSPDFERDGNGNPISGSEVWLQSMLRGLL